MALNLNRLAIGLNPNEMCPVSNAKRLFFAFFYEKQSQPQFRYAAEFWMSAIKLEYLVKPAKDKTELIPFNTELDFKDKWRKLHALASNGYEVHAGIIFGHGSNNLNIVGRSFYGRQIQSGLHFAPNSDVRKEDKTPNTLTKTDIESLAELPWNREYGYMILSNCYSGVEKLRNWSPAQVFSKSQKIPTVGQSRASSFSLERRRLIKIGEQSRKIYLWGYDTETTLDIISSGASFSGGTGMQIAGKVYSPK